MHEETNMDTPMALAARNQRTNFSMIRQDSAPKKISINPADERITSVVSAKTKIEGNLNFSEGVKIDGVVEGTVNFGSEDGLCILSKGARIEGSLNGPRAFVMGDVEGDINVDGTLVLAPSAVVVGTIRCGKFVVYDGATIAGSIETIKPGEKATATKPADDRSVVNIKAAGVR
jgi:cytoskeletal protein CcmA (bactofilin family)